MRPFKTTGMSVFRILTATYTDRVETLSFDPDAKSLSITSSLTVGQHPSWITPHPENSAIWFAGLEQDDGRVVAIEYDKDGKGKVVGELSSEGADPCTLVAHKGDLLIGNVSFFSLEPVVRIFTTLIYVPWWIYTSHSIRAGTLLRFPSFPRHRTSRRPRRSSRSVVPGWTRIGSFHLTLIKWFRIRPTMSSSCQTSATTRPCDW